jgi:hypothetical protein
MANPLEFSSNLSVGIAAIQAAALGSGATTAPLYIYVPAGDYLLTDPITITRHKVTLEIDGGATIHVASGKQGLVLNGAGNADGFLMHLVIRSYGVIQGTDFTTELDAVYLNSLIHSDLFFNEIKWVGRDGIRMNGSCFSNKIIWNRIHGNLGWNINLGGGGMINSTLFDGECQAAGLGGIGASLRIKRRTVCLRFFSIVREEIPLGSGLRAMQATTSRQPRRIGHAMTMLSMRLRSLTIRSRVLTTISISWPARAKVSISATAQRISKPAAFSILVGLATPIRLSGKKPTS